MTERARALLRPVYVHFLFEQDFFRLDKRYPDGITIIRTLKYYQVIIFRIAIGREGSAIVLAFYKIVQLNYFAVHPDKCIFAGCGKNKV